MYNSFPKILSWEYERIMDEGFTRKLRCVYFEGTGKVLCYVGEDYQSYCDWDYFELEMKNYQSILDCVQHTLKTYCMSNKDLISNKVFD